MKISVLGLGYIGLPTSLLLADAGYDIIQISDDEFIITGITYIAGAREQGWLIKIDDNGDMIWI